MAYRNVAYVEVNSNQLSNVGCYLLADGKPFFDIACIFAANIDVDEHGNPMLWLNPQVSALLNTTDQVKQLQGRGIAVLLSVLNNHKAAGWSCFTDPAVAQQFAGQLASCVAHFGLDGIDIDDEYADCAPNDTSLAMVTYELREAMPDKVISKALWSDSEYFAAKWQGHTLAQSLTYGWEMTYGDTDYEGRLQPYVEAGMPLDTLSLGVDTGGSDGPTAASYVTQNGVGGLMVFNVTNACEAYLAPVAEVMYGQGIVVPSGCLS